VVFQWGLWVYHWQWGVGSEHISFAHIFRDSLDSFCNVGGVGTTGLVRPAGGMSCTLLTKSNLGGSYQYDLS